MVIRETLPVRPFVHPHLRPAASRALFLLAFLSAACGSDKQPTAVCRVSAVSVSPGSVNVVTGSVRQLTANVSHADCSQPPSVTWTSNAPNVAAVTAFGVVTGLSPGSAAIVAASMGVSGTANVIVTVPPVASVTVTPSAPSIGIGGTVQLVATLRDADGNVLTGRSVTWTSSSPGVATVNQGFVTAVASGTTNIVATSEGRSGSTTVTVMQPVATVTLSPSSTTVLLGSTTAPPTVTARGNNGSVVTGRPVTWSSSNPNVLTVTSTGTFTAIDIGTAALRATVDGVVGSMTVQVNVTEERRRFAFAAIEDGNTPVGASYYPAQFENATGVGAFAVRLGTGQYSVYFGRLGKLATANFRENIFVTPLGTLGETCSVTGWFDSLINLDIRVECRLGANLVNSRFLIAVVGSSTLGGNNAFMLPFSATSSSSADQSFSYSSLNGAQSNTRTATGSYSASLQGLASNGTSTAFVTSLTDVGRNCQVRSWTNSTSMVNVDCTAPRSSALADSRFMVLMMDQGRPDKRWGFAFIAVPNTVIGVVADAPANNQRQSNGGVTQYIHRDVGKWDVLFRGLARRNGAEREIIMVSAWGPTPANCQVEFWNPSSGSDVGVIVRCFNRQTGAAMDVPFTILLLE